MKERDLVGSQLIRRNDEVSLLYEKMKIMEMTLHKGELQYKDRLEDIRLLKLEIRSLRTKNNRLEQSNEAGDDLRYGLVCRILQFTCIGLRLQFQLVLTYGALQMLTTYLLTYL